MTVKRKRIVTAHYLSAFIAVISYSCTYDLRGDVPVLCDKKQITFSQSIQPILNNNCVACHSGGSPAGGLGFETYEGVYEPATNGSLVGAIKHMDGFVPMPQLAPMLPDCEIMKIEKWVNDGALNN